MQSKERKVWARAGACSLEHAAQWAGLGAGGRQQGGPGGHQGPSFNHRQTWSDSRFSNRHQAGVRRLEGRERESGGWREG